MVAESVIASEIIVISPSLDELSVSIVILFGSTEALVIETVLPEASLVDMLPPRETLVEPVMSTVLIFPLAPIAPLIVTVLVLPFDEEIVISSLERPVIAAVVIAPPAEFIVVLLANVMAPYVIASSELAMVPFKVTVPPPLVVVNPPLKVKVSPLASPNCKVPSLAKETALVTAVSYTHLRDHETREDIV